MRSLLITNETGMKLTVVRTDRVICIGNPQTVATIAPSEGVDEATFERTFPLPPRPSSATTSEWGSKTVFGIDTDRGRAEVRGFLWFDKRPGACKAFFNTDVRVIDLPAGIVLEVLRREWVSWKEYSWIMGAPPEVVERIRQKEQEERDKARHREAFRRAAVPHNAACERLFSRIRQGGLTCPHCGRHSIEYRLSTREGYRSAVICSLCGWIVELDI